MAVSWNEPQFSYGTINMANPISITANESTFQLSVPAHYVSGGTYYLDSNASRYFTISYSFYNNTSELTSTSTLTSSTVANDTNGAYIQAANATSRINTSSLFTSANKTTRTVPVIVYVKNSALFTNGNEMWWMPPGPSNSFQVSTVNVTLDAPPSFSGTPSISKNTDGYYRNVTTVSVTSSATAQYGGTISSTKLIIGSQTATINGNGTVSLRVNELGTFTPTVVVTDSRGQTKTTTLSDITVVEGSPVTFNYTQPVSNKDGFWTDKATASITISNLTVPYSGSATAKFTIGDQSVTRNDNGTLSIIPSTSGTFTPTLTVTDSFGRVYIENLNTITINRYTAPNISYQVYRAKNVTEGGITKYGIKDEESTTHILVESTITYIKNVGNLLKPTVTLEAVITNNITWYASYDETNGLSNEVNWTNFNPNSPIVLYALISGSFAIENSFIVGITAHDSSGGNSIEILKTLPPAFFTIDFLAGGHGISIGQIASQEGFYCAMDANFKDFSGVMRSMFNIFYPKGSYYETNLTYEIPSGSSTPTSSDLESLGSTWFNPNYAWGGTWILETAGQVHVSAGTGYGVNGANTNTSDGGEKTHLLTGAESGVKSHTHTINHGHGFTQPTVNGGNHKHLQKSYVNRASYGSGSVNARFTQENNTTYTEFDGGHTHSVSGGAVTDHAGSSGGTTETNATTAHNNMQPYINVYRWHRTA